MKQINYILVNETGSETAVRAIHCSTVSELRYHSNIVVAPRKWQVPGSKERKELLDQLVFLRRHYPDAKILGVSEVDTSSSYAPIKVSAAMNALRREMSDLP